MSAQPDDLERGRESFARRSWRDAYSHLGDVDRAQGLEPEDLIRHAMAAYLIGRDEESVEILTRAHRQALDADSTAQAVRAAFWIFFFLINKGDIAPAGGWFARGQRLAEGLPPGCAEAGFMLVPPALQALFGGDPETALSRFDAAVEVAERCNDPDLLTLTYLGRANALINLGRTSEGAALFDEVMITATSEEVSPVLTGLVYCAMIAVCQDVFDLRRAQEWTHALTQWCAAQPDLVPFRGQCLVHRAEVMQLRGAWPAAVEEAQRAREQLLHSPDKAAVGMAYYQLGELHRLRGEVEEATAAYREANKWGHAPQPGLTKMRMEQGDIGPARSAIDRLLEEAGGVHSRAKLLPTYVEVMLATGDLEAARRGCEELIRIAEDIDTPFVTALAAAARGAVLLAESEPMAALPELRSAWSLWRELDVPYEAARVRTLIGIACRDVGDEDAAAMELDAARWAFEQLGAVPDVERVESLLGSKTPSPAEGLTGREVEVLGLVATGRTNRDIAEQLVISEKTVARHVSNIFIKLGVPSRAAATAYAYEHHLV